MFILLHACVAQNFLLHQISQDETPPAVSPHVIIMAENKTSTHRKDHAKPPTAEKAGGSYLREALNNQ